MQGGCSVYVLPATGKEAPPAEIQTTGTTQMQDKLDEIHFWAGLTIAC